MSRPAQASCLYAGTVAHRRLDPPREFTHRLEMAYVDLEELPRLLGGRLVRRGPGALRMRRRDYHGDPEVPLDLAVRETVRLATGKRPEGPIRLLTNLRSFGVCFNPVSFYYCFDRRGQALEAVLAEVTNTPWRQRHAYVIKGDSGEVGKAMRVSPFMDMEQRYAVSASAPDTQLHVEIASHRDGETVFEATLAMERRELSRVGTLRFIARYPAASVRVLALIYGHALGLRLAGLPVLWGQGGSPA